MDQVQSKCLADIEKHGCHIVHVMAEDDLPSFSYTIGIQRTTGAPEAVVFGLKPQVAGFVLNEYSRRVRRSEPLAIGRLHGGFLEGFECLIQRVDERHYEEHFGMDLWLYDGSVFDVVQLVYPTTRGVWPWAPGAPEGFRHRQPLLTASGLPELDGIDLGPVWPFDQPPNAATVVSKAVLEGAAPIVFVSHDEDDHGWQFLHTDESIDDVDALALVCLSHVLELDPSMSAVADLEPGWIAMRAGPSKPWIREPAPPEEE